MGAVNSCCIPHYYHDHDPKEKGNKGSSFRNHRRNLSATFNLSTVEDESEAHSYVNINTATEEELMTLPGVDRTIAKNVVNYRRQIGGYRRVEDLALVSGVGAERLERIRGDICIGSSSKTAASSRDSSLRGSRYVEGGDSAAVERRERNGGRAATSPQPLVVNVNKANMYQLAKIKGVGLQLAENIVTYREKNGPFKAVEDLVKVKGIAYGILSAIRPYISLDSDLPPPSPASPPSDAPPSFANGRIPGSESAGVLPPSEPQPLSEYQKRSMTSVENLLQVGI
jgi:competence ComEA-like helix-hairpin-helix protein